MNSYDQYVSIREHKLGNISILDHVLDRMLHEAGKLMDAKYVRLTLLEDLRGTDMKTKIVQRDGFTEVIINGNRLEEVTSAQVNLHADSVCNVQVGMNLQGPFVFEGDANVLLLPRVFPGWRLEVTTREDGTKVYRCVKDE